MRIWEERWGQGGSAAWGNLSAFSAATTDSRPAVHSAAVIRLIVLAAAITAGTPSAADLRGVAALPGEPHIVSAAANGPDGQPVWTLENASPFDTTDRRLRIVIFGRADDGEAAQGVLETVRWFKSAAPAELRRQCLLSALPVADLADPHVRRWIDFQAADLRVEITGRGDGTPVSQAAPLSADAATGGKIDSMTVPASSAVDAIMRALVSRDRMPSALHEALARRAARDPIEIARVLARRYPQTPAISYIPAVAWVNTMRLADLTGDAALRTKVLGEIRPWVAGEKPLFGSPILLTAIAGTMIFADRANADRASPAGALAIEGARLASEVKETGIAAHGQGWTDDMFMTSAILARTSRFPERASDLDAAAHLLIDYAGRLQRPDGIFVHATEGPFAWGRGNGFAALGLIEVLSALPDRHPLREQILGLYRRQMAAVRAAQAPDGAWRQVIDEPGAYREETATAMLATAMARGIRWGWLDSTYLDTVRRAWRALAAHVGDDGSLVDVCAGTGAGPTRQYYLDRPAITGFDDRGGAMALAAAMELHELSQTK
jgi:unsaturated rhamnogalacturonyl hydrolase